VLPTLSPSSAVYWLPFKPTQAPSAAAGVSSNSGASSSNSFANNNGAIAATAIGCALIITAVLAFCLWTNRGKGGPTDSPFTRWVEWQARSKEASATHDASNSGSSALSNGEPEAPRISAVAEYDAIYLGQGQSRSPAFVPHVASRSLSVAGMSPSSRANFSSSSSQQQRRASRYTSDLNNNL